MKAGDVNQFAGGFTYQSINKYTALTVACVLEPSFTRLNMKWKPNPCQCGSGKFDYNEKYDEYYCKDCLSWLYPKCPDPNCYYCPGRPDKANVPCLKRRNKV